MTVGFYAAYKPEFVLMIAVKMEDIPAAVVCVAV